MLEFITLLRERYQAQLPQLSHESATVSTFTTRIEQLIFAEAWLRKGQLFAAEPQFPIQIAVIGPTQAGKSSLSNVILNSQVAQISPLAGYTVHPQGFCVEVPLAACYGLQHYFGRFQQLSVEQLSKNRYDCYALAENTHPSPFLPPCVLWDTPDFDSIDAEDYKEGFIRTLALADIIVLVLSKEKYADQSVWELMHTLQTFKQPTLLCINKLNADNEEIIIHSLTEKWKHARNDPFPPVIPLFYAQETGLPRWPSHAAHIFFQLSKKIQRAQHKHIQQAFIHQYWQDWIEPVLAEQHRQQTWLQWIDKLIEQALTDYQRDYLNHPHHYETFQKAVLECLQLLEIPGIAKVVSPIRRFLTWPFRQLMQLSQQREFAPYLNQEQVLLHQIGEHLLIQLAEQVLEHCHADDSQLRWWKSLYRLIREQHRDILCGFDQAVIHHQQHFEQDVDAAAQRLYTQLQRHPLILNSLRATRLSTDAALLGLMVQTGGIGIHDIFITPVMLSITSLLTESAIGGYMKKVEIELKSHQLATVKQNVFVNALRQLLIDLPHSLAQHQQFGISPEQLHQAQQQQLEKRHGLRFF